MVAPLNWGLGHATRCIPIIKALSQEGYSVTIASDGQALRLLTKEFPNLPKVALPSYNITYAEKGKHFKFKLLLQLRQINKAIRAEHKFLQSYIKTHAIEAIISDSRFGMYSKKIPSVVVSHQLTVLSGRFTTFSSFIHGRFLKKFNECWVPDYKDTHSLSGKLGSYTKRHPSIQYIGPLSRMKKEKLPQKYKIAAILSGPEPQRSLLEKILIDQLKKYNGNVLIVRGIIGDDIERKQSGNIELVNFLTSQELERAINQSEFIISRSGYTSIMDMAALQKKVYFIPTPGQPEQEYLAQYFKEKHIAPFSTQEDFKIKKLSNLALYKGFSKPLESAELGDFFGLFQRKGKLGAHAKLAFHINFLLVRLNNMLYNREAQT